MPLGRVREAARKQEDDRKWLPRVNVEDFLDALEVQHVRRATADEILYSCPLDGHTHGDSRPSAYMNTGEKDPSKTTSWKCHGCGRQGTAVALYAMVENVSKQEARRILKAQYAPGFTAPKDGIVAELDRAFKPLPPRAHVNLPLASALYAPMEVDWPTVYAEWTETKSRQLGYFFERGFEPETLMDFNIGFDEISHRWTIPVHDHRGNMIGIKARTPGKKVRPKYKILGDKGRRNDYGFEPYEKSRVLFGLDRLIESWCVLVEGELDVMALAQAGYPAVASGSAHLSPVQQRLLRDRVDLVVVWFDEGEAGEVGTWGYYDEDKDFHPGVVQVLEPHLRVRVVVDDHPDDPAELIRMQRPTEIGRLIDGAQSSLTLRGMIPATP
jgi:Toprim-like